MAYIHRFLSEGYTLVPFYGIWRYIGEIRYPGNNMQLEAETFQKSLYCAHRMMKIAGENRFLGYFADF